MTLIRTTEPRSGDARLEEAIAIPGRKKDESVEAWSARQKAYRAGLSAETREKYRQTDLEYNRVRRPPPTPEQRMAKREATRRWRARQPKVERRRDHVRELVGGEQGFVYVVRFRDALKIGFSSDVDRRLRDVPHDEELARIPCTGRDLEAELHLKFAHLRIPLISGSREWFKDTAEIRKYVRLMKDRARAAKK